MSSLSHAERSLRASIAVETSWANTLDRSARTRPGREAAFEKFMHEVDPDGNLPVEERRRRAEHLQRAHMKRLALASARARRLRKDAA